MTIEKPQDETPDVDAILAKFKKAGAEAVWHAQAKRVKDGAFNPNAIADAYNKAIDDVFETLTIEETKALAKYCNTDD